MSESFVVLRTAVEVVRYLQPMRAQGQSFALVPTMGSLHEGHLSLVKKAAQVADIPVVSIFVNPTQFGPNEDLAAYPRDEPRDLELARAAGARLAFCPSVLEMYPGGEQTSISVTPLSSPLCGRTRPGHFSGVATVVAKLLNIIGPDHAVFGQKDFQQLAVIRRMARDLSFQTKIIGMPIVREESGLAMSSRNRYLSEEGRVRASTIFAGLRTAEELFHRGETAAAALKGIAAREMGQHVDIEYLELRDAETLRELEDVKIPAVLAVAGRVDGTRLIDNIVLTP